MKPLFALLAAALILCAVGTASAQEPLDQDPNSILTAVLRGNTYVLLRDGAEIDELPLGCRKRVVVQNQQKTYVLCTNSTLVVLREHSNTLPDVLERRVLWNNPRNLMVFNNRVWIISRDLPPYLVHERPFDIETVLAPNAHRAITPTLGTVRSVRGETVRVQLDEDEVVEPGELVEVLSADVRRNANGPRYVLPVLSFENDIATLRLGMNERIAPGDRVRVSARVQTHTTFAPPRLGNLWQLSLRPRGVIPVSIVALGLGLDAQATYHFLSPLAVGVSVEPTLLVIAPRTSPLGSQVDVPGGAVLARGFVGYDHQYVGLDLSFGVAAVASTTSSQFEVQPTYGAHLRFGALDGFSFQFDLALAHWDQSVHLANIKFDLQIPLPVTWLEFHGAGGENRLLLEMGWRILARGNGDHGSLFFEPTLGLVDFPLTTPTFGRFDGVVIGLGIEYRP